MVRDLVGLICLHRNQVGTDLLYLVIFRYWVYDIGLAPTNGNIQGLGSSFVRMGHLAFLFALPSNVGSLMRRLGQFGHTLRLISFSFNLKLR